MAEESKDDPFEGIDCKTLGQEPCRPRPSTNGVDVVCENCGKVLGKITKTVLLFGGEEIELK